MAKIYVTLGKKASSFRDQSQNITILPGQVVELNLYQQNQPKIRSALNGGHLIMVADPKQAPEGPKVKTPEELREEFFAMVEVEKDTNKIIKYFTLDQFKQIAELEGIEVDEKDTKKTIFEALIDEE